VAAERVVPFADDLGVVIARNDHDEAQPAPAPGMAWSLPGPERTIRSRLSRRSPARSGLSRFAQSATGPGAHVSANFAGLLARSADAA
jgi:hypothetical protein